MKKLLLCAALSIALCALPLSACNDATDEVAGYCYTCNGESSQKLVLPISFERAWHVAHGTAFVSESTLEEIKTSAERKAGICATIYGENYLLVEYVTEGEKCCYVVAKTRENSFLFFCPHFRLTENFKATVPVYLFDIQPADLSDEFEAEKAYKLNYPKELIYEYYHRAEAYDISENDGAYTVSVKEGAQVSESVITRGAFGITFEIRPDGTYATFHIQTLDK